MLRIDRFVTLLLLATMLLSACQPLVAPESAEIELVTEELAPPLDEATKTDIEALIEQTMADNQIPGFAIGIVRDGEVVYTKGFGFAESGTDRAMTPETLIPVASLTKQFTAAAIMQLVEEGMIDLDAPATESLPYFEMADARFTDITVRQLLAHTSGIPQIPQREYGYDSSDPGLLAREAHIRELANFELAAAPGEAWSYSSLSYNVLGETIATVSGQPYEAYLQQHIMTPLGMSSSTFILDEIDIDSLASGHYLDETGSLVVNEAVPYTRAYAPSTGLVTNLNDMMHWAMAMSNRGAFARTRVVQESSCDAMWSPVAALGWGGLMQNYGLGWIVAEADGHRLVWHIGTNPGYEAHLIIAPDDGIGVVTLDNFLSPTEDPPWFATDVAMPRC